MARVADAKLRAADPQRAIAIDDDPRLPARIVGVEAARAAHILGDDLPILAAVDAQMVGSDVRIVDHDIVVVATSDADFRAVAAVPCDDFAMASQDLDPDHFMPVAPGAGADQPIAPRKRRPIESAFA